MFNRRQHGVARSEVGMGVCVAGLFISCSVILSFEFEGGTFLLFPRRFSFCFCVPAN